VISESIWSRSLVATDSNALETLSSPKSQRKIHRIYNRDRQELADQVHRKVETRRKREF